MSVGDFFGQSPQSKLTPSLPRKRGRPRGSVWRISEQPILGSSVLLDDPELRQLIESALDGTLIRTVPLARGEPRKLRPRHIPVVIMNAMGFSGLRISQVTGYGRQMIYNINKHPFAKAITRAILVKTSATVAKDIEARFLQEAPAMQQVLVDIAFDEAVKPELRAKVAFGWLQQGGFSKERKAEAPQGTQQVNININARQASLLTAAIEETKEISPDEYVVFGSTDAVGPSPASDGGVSLSTPAPKDNTLKETG